MGNGPDRRDRGPLPGVLSLLRDHKCCPSQSSYRLETHTVRERGDKREKSKPENLPVVFHLTYGRSWALVPRYLANRHSGCSCEEVWKWDLYLNQWTLVKQVIITPAWHEWASSNQLKAWTKTDFPAKGRNSASSQPSDLNSSISSSLSPAGLPHWHWIFLFVCLGTCQNVCLFRDLLS